MTSPSPSPNSNPKPSSISQDLGLVLFVSKTAVRQPLCRTNGKVYYVQFATAPTHSTLSQPPMTQAAGVRGEGGNAQVDLQGAPSAWTYERRASVKLAKSQLRTVRASFENPSLEPKVHTSTGSRSQKSHRAHATHVVSSS